MPAIQIFACGSPSLWAGVKSFQELPLSTILNYSISNILSASPTKLKPSGFVAAPNQFEASSEVVAHNYKVIKHKASSAGSGFVPTYSSNLQLLQTICFPFNIS